MFPVAVLLSFVLLSSTLPIIEARDRLEYRMSAAGRLCAIHPWPELCKANLLRGRHAAYLKPVSIILPPNYEGKLRVMRGTSELNDARKFSRALRSIEEKGDAEKKSDRNGYDFIRFG